MTLLDEVRKRDTYIGQFEVIAAISAFLSFTPEFFKGRPVQLWIDNSGAIGCLIKGYSGTCKADCAKLVNAFHFVVATRGLASLYIDYVPTDSNVADVPSRWHEMSAAEREEWIPCLLASSSNRYYRTSPILKVGVSRIPPSQSPNSGTAIHHSEK